jgi:hypothetical protein
MYPKSIKFYRVQLLQDFLKFQSNSYMLFFINNKFMSTSVLNDL